MVARPTDFEAEPSVLVTDDNDAWREAVREVLEREGFRTLQAACGEEAIELVRTEWLDIVLIDFHMPRLDGIETVREIRQFDDRLPAVLMTGQPAAVPLDEVQALRIATVLAKPAGRDLIVRTVVSLYRRRL